MFRNKSFNNNNINIIIINEFPCNYAINYAKVLKVEVQIICLFFLFLCG